MTIEDLIRNGYTLHAACRAATCMRTAQLDLERLKGRLGAGHGTLAADLAPKLRCSKCGGKDVGLVMSPPSQTRINANIERDRVTAD
jgi:hypothetical protein